MAMKMYTVVKKNQSITKLYRGPARLDKSQKNMVMGPAGPRTKNDCAGEASSNLPKTRGEVSGTKATEHRNIRGRLGYLSP
jgi:hypothetical protein